MTPTEAEPGRYPCLPDGRSLNLMSTDELLTLPPEDLDTINLEDIITLLCTMRDAPTLVESECGLGGKIRSTGPEPLSLWDIRGARPFAILVENTKRMEELTAAGFAVRLTINRTADNEEKIKRREDENGHFGEEPNDGVVGNGAAGPRVSWGGDKKMLISFGEKFWILTQESYALLQVLSRVKTLNEIPPRIRAALLRTTANVEPAPPNRSVGAVANSAETAVEIALASSPDSK